MKEPKKRCTALIEKEGISIDNIQRLTSGRGIAAMFMDTWIINVYAPSGAERRHDLECFFNSDITYFLQMISNNVILAGDTNYVVSSNDCTGKPNVSRTLLTLNKGLGLYDA
jgi:exonuclease III